TNIPRAKICKKFYKSRKIEDYTTTQKAIEDIISAKLQELPERPNLISEEIRNILPFEPPIKKMSQTTAIKETKPLILSTLVKLQEHIENKEIKLQIELPITTQQEIIPMINKLKEYFEIPQILNYLLNLPELPAPS
ncbi:8991_t:CDS:2, partial [Scutellospora calospora]